MEFVAGAAHRDASDGDERGGSACGDDFGKGGELGVWDWAVFDFPAKVVAGERLGGVGGDGSDDVFAGGDDERDVVGVGLRFLYANEAGGGEFVDFSSSFGVEVKSDSEAIFFGAFREPENRSVVSTEFGAASSFRCRSNEVFEDEGIDGMNTMIDSGGHDEDDKRVFVARIETELRA